MPKKTTILILILAVVTGILLFLAVSNQKQSAPLLSKPTPTKKVVTKTAKVFFNPQTIDLTSGTASPTSSVDIMIDTGSSEIAGAQIELKYDPKSLVSLKLSPANETTSFFGPNAAILFNEVNQTTGRVSFAIAITPQAKTKKGVGKIATLTFSKAFSAQGATTISFLDKTIVTILGENDSVLKESTPLNVVLSTQSNAPFVPPSTTQ